MRRFFYSVGCALLLAGCSSDDVARYQHAAAATVLIESDNGSGSGFIIKRSNHLFVFTAAHVVDTSSDVKVHQEIRTGLYPTGDAVYPAHVIVRDDDIDLAVLLLDAPADKLGHVEFDLGEFLPGTPVYHVGNFYGKRLQNSFSTGVISQVGVHPSENFHWPIADQMTCLIIQGSSGGPVFDYSDRVIGVAVGTVIPGIEFFVPLRAVNLFATQHKVRWLLHGFWCPDDSVLAAMREASKYAAPVSIISQPSPIAPSAPGTAKPKTKTK